MAPDELLRVYEVEARGSFVDRLPAGWTSEQDGPLTRCVMPRGGFAMFTADASGLSRDELVALVDRTFAYYAERGLEFEWKTFDHDRADLIPLLVERGSVPEPHETLIMGSASALAEQPQLPIGLTMTSAVDRADLERVAELMSEVWDEDRAWVADDLEKRIRSTEPIEVLVVQDGDLVVSAAWLVPLPGTRVAGLWGGSTRPVYRGRGITGR